MRFIPVLALALLLLGCRSEPPTLTLAHGLDVGDSLLVLRGVTVIDGLGSQPAPDQVVVLRGDRIEAVMAEADFAPGDSVRVVDLSGHFVMPGLIDMHAHITILPMENGRLAARMDRAASEEVLRTLLAFGITTVRNPAAPNEDGAALREAVASGDLLGPTIRTAGRALNARRSGFGPFVGTPDADAVRVEVRQQASDGVDYVKVYASMPPDLIAVAIEEAHAQGIEVVGHLQRTTWTAAARLGIDHLTHGAPWSAAYLPDSVRATYRGRLKDRMTWLEHIDLDGPSIREMIAVMADSGVTLDPTLIASHTKFAGDDEGYLANPDSVYAPRLVRDLWRRGSFTDDWAPEDYARGRAAWPRMLALTKALHEGGVVLTAGSDLPNPWVVPGASLHDELILLHSADIPPLEVLKMATYNGAVSLKMEGEIGSIEAGKQADLLILTADPSRDLANSRAIVWVVRDGVFYDPDTLRSTGPSP